MIGEVSGRQKTAFKILISIFLLSALLFLFYPFQEVSETVSVVEVTDGDTIEVDHQGETRKIRLKHVDTPETSGYNTPEEFERVPEDNWKCLERWGYRATDYVEQELGEDAVLEYRKGVMTVERGNYGRLLGDFRLQGRNRSLSYFLVEKGYARSYGEYYIELEEEARNSSRGLWGECVE